MRLPRDLREFVELLNSENVEFLIAGGWALGFHARPRFTYDLDILVKITPENATRLVTAIRKFGFGSLGLQEADFLGPAQVIQLGQAPNRIDLLTSLSGLSADEAWTKRISGEIDGVPVYFLSREALIKNKRATGRKQDLADLETLESNE